MDMFRVSKLPYAARFYDKVGAQVRLMFCMHFYLALMYVRTDLDYNMQKCQQECPRRFGCLLRA